MSRGGFFFSFFLSFVPGRCLIDQNVGGPVELGISRNRNQHKTKPPRAQNDGARQYLRQLATEYTNSSELCIVVPIHDLASFGAQLLFFSSVIFVRPCCNERLEGAVATHDILVCLLLGRMAEPVTFSAI